MKNKLITREHLKNFGFVEKTYPRQDGVFFTKELLAKDMSWYMANMFDYDYVSDESTIVVEVCPNDTVQVVDDLEFVAEEMYSENGQKILISAGVIL